MASPLVRLISKEKSKKKTSWNIVSHILFHLTISYYCSTLHSPILIITSILMHIYSSNAALHLDHIALHVPALLRVPAIINSAGRSLFTPLNSFWNLTVWFAELLWEALHSKNFLTSVYCSNFACLFTCLLALDVLELKIPKKNKWTRKKSELIQSVWWSEFIEEIHSLTGSCGTSSFQSNFCSPLFGKPKQFFTAFLLETEKITRSNI